MVKNKERTELTTKLNALLPPDIDKQQISGNLASAILRSLVDNLERRDIQYSSELQSDITSCLSNLRQLEFHAGSYTPNSMCRFLMNYEDDNNNNNILSRFLGRIAHAFKEQIDAYKVAQKSVDDVFRPLAMP